jgi:hypothetical protein
VLVSNKRSKAGRKKQLKQRAARTGGSTRQADDPKAARQEIDMGQSGFEDPEVQTPVETSSGGGVLLKLRGGIAHKEIGENASTMHKQRSLLEWSVWLIAAVAVGFFIWRYVQGQG